MEYSVYSPSSELLMTKKENMDTTNPLEAAIFTASSVHDIISGDREQRVRCLLKLLQKYHGVQHISQDDVDAYVYQQWCEAHEDLKKAVIGGERSADDLVKEDATVTPRCVSRYLTMEIGAQEELTTLSLVEKYFNDRAKEKATEGSEVPEYIVESDQSRRVKRVGGVMIQVVGRFDGLLKTNTPKRPVKGIVEIKTRMQSYRDNPADKTQLAIYAMMIPKVTVYALVERIRGSNDIKVTRWRYDELEAHWNNVIEPGLKKAYVELCALWRQRQEPTDDNYAGKVYATELIALIDHFREILKALGDSHGMPLLPGVLSELKYEVAANVQRSYEALCKRLTPSVVHKIQQKDIAFFEHNILTLAAVSGQYEETLRSYTAGVATMIRDGITDSTREKIWALVNRVIATV